MHSGEAPISLQLLLGEETSARLLAESNLKKEEGEEKGLVNFYMADEPAIWTVKILQRRTWIMPMCFACRAWNQFSSGITYSKQFILCSLILTNYCVAYIAHVYKCHSLVGIKYFWLIDWQTRTDRTTKRRPWWAYIWCRSCRVARNWRPSLRTEHGIREQSRDTID